MKSTRIFGIALALVLTAIAGCSRPERIIDNSQDEWKILTATDAVPSALTLIHQPDGVIISSDIFSKVNGSPLSGKISKIVEFRENLYLLIPSAFQIVVVDKDYKKRTVIDLSASGRIPTDIAFGNATTAYIAHENDTTVSVLDITNFKIARSITVGNHPIAIAAIGNQIFVANQASNTVSQIDTRTNTVVATHAVAPAPTFVQPNINNGHEVIVLSLGSGKIDSDPKSAPVATFIDSARIIIQATKLDNELFGGVDANPIGMVLSSLDWIFIPVQKGVIQLDSRDKIAANLVLEQEYSRIFYNFRRDELLLLNNTTGTITDGNGTKKDATFTLPLASTAILGL
jgi:YVTN family beta-propeller protein